MSKTFRERLTDNANDFDTIVSEILAENETLRADAEKWRTHEVEVQKQLWDSLELTKQ